MALTCCAVVDGSRAASPQRQITIVFRYDDYANQTSPLDFDRGLIDAFREHDLRATFTVIPFERQKQEDEEYYETIPKKVVPLTPEKAALLTEGIEAGTLEVVLHGYIHREVRPERPWTEFAGVPLEEQSRRISEGKQALEEAVGCEVKAFVPPFNTYDGNTLRVLQEQGFRTLSAGWLPVPEGDHELKFLPITCERIVDLRQAVETARQSSQRNPLIAVMMHPHDFRDVDPQKAMLSLKEFRELLAWVAAQDDVETRTIAEVVTAEDRELGVTHYRNYCAVRPEATRNILPPQLRSGVSKVLYYPDPKTLQGIKTKVTTRMALYYGGIALLVFLIGYFALAKFPVLAAPAAYAGTLALAALAIYVFRDAEVYYQGASFLAFVAGGCAAAWCRYCCRPGRTNRQGHLKPEATKASNKEQTTSTAAEAD
jgi:predicted deacetylase